MKKLLLLLAAASGLQVQAQNINPGGGDYAPSVNAEPAEQCCSGLGCRWVMDVNVTGGALWQELTTVNQVANYPNALNANISAPEFRNGVSRGLDVQGAYFFGKKCNFGVGLGLMYMYQEGDLVMDNFHVEYRSTDNFGNTFRQVLTGNGRIKESLRTHNLSIPVVFKYQTWFTKKVGFTADAGLLFNLVERVNYSTGSSFDYEAIYKYSGAPGQVVPVYDNSPTPSADALLLTRQYASEHGLNSDNYLNDLRSKGYNVGLGVKPGISSGNVNYNSGSVGILLRPAITLAMCSNTSLNLGVYYIYQDFSHSTGSYRVTDKVGTYNTMVNGISRSVNHSLGLNIGVRYTFGKCCKKQCEPAPAPEPEPEPARDPEPTPDPEPEPEDEVTAPILFDVDKTVIKKQAVPILEDAAKKIKSKKASGVEIHGYTDNTGDPVYNKELSKKRAAAVKNYLKRKGVKSDKMETIGHGPKEPAASNRTPKGRMLNRRVIMKLKTK